MPVCGTRDTQAMKPKAILVSVELIRSLVTKQEPGREVRGSLQGPVRTQSLMFLAVIDELWLKGVAILERPVPVSSESTRH